MKVEYFAYICDRDLNDIRWYSKTEEELANKLDKNFNMWVGMQSRGSNPTLEDYLKNKKKIKLTIEEL